MSSLSHVAPAYELNATAGLRSGLLLRASTALRSALAASLNQWTQACAQRQAQALRDVAQRLVNYDVHMAADLRAAADRHEISAR
jgi:hypothetical protein